MLLFVCLLLLFLFNLCSCCCCCMCVHVCVCHRVPLSLTHTLSLSPSTVVCVYFSEYNGLPKTPFSPSPPDFRATRYFLERMSPNSLRASCRSKAFLLHVFLTLHREESTSLVSPSCVFSHSRRFCLLLNYMKNAKIACLRAIFSCNFHCILKPYTIRKIHTLPLNVQLFVNSHKFGFQSNKVRKCAWTCFLFVCFLLGESLSSPWLHLLNWRGVRLVWEVRITVRNPRGHLIKYINESAEWVCLSTLHTPSGQKSVLDDIFVKHHCT